MPGVSTPRPVSSAEAKNFTCRSSSSVALGTSRLGSRVQAVSAAAIVAMTTKLASQYLGSIRRRSLSGILKIRLSWLSADVEGYGVKNYRTGPKKLFAFAKGDWLSVFNWGRVTFAPLFRKCYIGFNYPWRLNHGKIRSRLHPTGLRALS